MICGMKMTALILLLTVWPKCLSWEIMWALYNEVLLLQSEANMHYFIHTFHTTWDSRILTSAENREMTTVEEAMGFSLHENDLIYKCYKTYRLVLKSKSLLNLIVNYQWVRFYLIEELKSKKPVSKTLWLLTCARTQHITWFGATTDWKWRRYFSCTLTMVCQIFHENMHSNIFFWPILVHIMLAMYWWNVDRKCWQSWTLRWRYCGWSNLCKDTVKGRPDASQGLVTNSRLLENILLIMSAQTRAWQWNILSCLHHKLWKWRWRLCWWFALQSVG